MLACSKIINFENVTACRAQKKMSARSAKMAVKYRRNQFFVLYTLITLHFEKLFTKLERAWLDASNDVLERQRRSLK